MASTPPSKPASPPRAASRLKSPLLWTVIIALLSALLLWALPSYLNLTTTSSSSPQASLIPHAPVPAPPPLSSTQPHTPHPDAAPPTPAEAVFPLRKFSKTQLQNYKGISSPSNPDALIYMAIRGKVYDVTAGRRFYGPGGPYNTFGGRDATVALARNRVVKPVGEEEELAEGEGPEAWRGRLMGGEWESLERWEGSLS
ncbi:hypothetical protein MMC08_005378 [Hypocenomyce scalaris]|nr:hypothetical protein [Hypocenomyce scalaris]